jgi:UDP-2,3-diacylglucosamine pyrophosphatase LpxH
MMEAVQPRYRAVWISDVHLGTRACRIEALLEFLRSLRCEYLYLVGDIVDVEALQRRWHWPESHGRAVRLLLDLARRGMKVQFIPGNHDAMFRAYAGYRFGAVQIRRDSVHYTADGRKVVILHGDQFDDIVSGHPILTAFGDRCYEVLLALSRGYDAVRRKFGWPYFSPATWVKRRVKTLCTFVSGYYKDLVDYARRRKADIVVTGHLHRPEIQDMDGLVYANCGDWVENCSALVEHDGGRLQVLHVGRDGVVYQPAPELAAAQA